MKPDNGYYVHQVPGRLRVRIPNIKENAVLGETVAEILQAIPGVYSVSVNTLTGSVKIKHDADACCCTEILDRLSEHRLFNADQAITNDQVFVKAASRAGERLSKVALSMVMGKALEGSSLSFLAALV
jgi:hypothetical protein